MSLFWEEKYIVLNRLIQLYALFFFTYYEYWPSAARKYFTPYFSFYMLSWNIWTQERYYDLIQSPNLVRTGCGFFLATMFCVLFCACCCLCSKKLRYRLEIVYTSLCWYKWLFWFCESIMLPLMFNTVWLANCRFYTLREAVTVADCLDGGNHWPNILYICMAACFLMVFVYNVILVTLINQAKISSEFHEY